MEMEAVTAPEIRALQGSSSNATQKEQPRAPQHGQRTYRRSQFWTNVGIGFTFLLAILIAVVVIVYNKKHSMTKAQKHAFETLSTGLLIFLGLNFAEGFQNLADHAQNFLMKHSRWARKNEAIVGDIASFKTVMDLCLSRVPAMVRLAAASWLLINIVAQIAVALISLTYSTVDGVNSNGTYTQPGTIKVSNMTCYMISPGMGCDMSRPNVVIGSQARAHSYGMFGEALDADDCTYESVADIEKSRHNCLYFRRDTPDTRPDKEYGFRFHEYNPNDTSRTYPRFTNRTMTASSGPCMTYDARDPATTPLPGAVTRYFYGNDTFKDQVDIPDVQTAADATTYLYRGTLKPEDAPVYSCGPRCLKVWAYKSASGDKKQPAKFYQCPITIGSVTNVWNESTQAISDGVTKVAAASIALQGRRSFDGTMFQAQLFAFGTKWEVHSNPAPDIVGARIAEFAIASLAYMSQRQPPLYVQGTVPHLGTSLDVKWGFLAALLGGIAFVHVVLWWTTGRLAKGSVERFRGSGGVDQGLGSPKGYVQILELNERDKHSR